MRHRGGLTRYTYRNHPFDVVGWAGCLYPFALSIHDFEPLTGRIHQPPPVHQTFAGPSFVVCSFVPRLFDYHPLAIPAPYNHANVDSDELLFYVDGDFMSRKGSGVGVGSISLHPAGFVHGPQPGSVEASIGATATEELAVMIDTFAPGAPGPGRLRLRGHGVRVVVAARPGGREGHDLLRRSGGPAGDGRAGAGQADGCDGSGGGGTGSGSSGMGSGGAGGWPGSGSVGGTGDGG